MIALQPQELRHRIDDRVDVVCGQRGRQVAVQERRRFHTPERRVKMGELSSPEVEQSSLRATSFLPTP